MDYLALLEFKLNHVCNGDTQVEQFIASLIIIDIV